MKKTLLTLLAISSFFNSAIANNEVEIDSKLSNVTVYLNGAQVARNTKITLKKGINTLYFNNVSPYINEKTIQVDGLGDYIILDTKKHTKYPKPEEAGEIPDEIVNALKKKRDSVYAINFDIQNVSNKLDFLKTEKNFLLTNKVFYKDSLIILKQSLSYLRKQLFEINELEQSLKKEQNILNSKRNSLNIRITALTNYQRNNTKTNNNIPTYQVVVTVQAKKELTGTMKLTYFVSNASWSPSYDIRVKDINSDVNLTMKATVYQNTGENWDNVNLTLSTNNPYKNKIKPELNTWYLNYYNPNMGYYEDAEQSEKRSNVAKKNAETLDEVFIVNKDVSSENIERKPTAIRSTNYTVKNQMMANVEYKIELKYSIKSDNKAHLIAVNQQNIKAKYNHYLVPKYDTESYLVAQLLDWEELDLLPSKANLFYEGSYIGETRINPTANDTLYISLGNDRNVRVKKIKDKEKSKDKVFSNRKSTTISYDLQVKNMNIQKYNIIVEDHIPVSKDNSIVVTLENKSKAEFDKKTGMITWEFELKGKQSKSLNYTFKVEYDNDKTIEL